MENPNYYAIIPAEIRYSKELSMFQKLLYAEITALTQKDGYCWASNKYFAELYEMGETYISKQISDLAKKGFLQVEINKEEGNKRRIFIGKIKRASGKTVSARPIVKNNKTYCTKVQDPYCTKVQENNININNKINIESAHKKIENNSIDFLKNISLKFSQGEDIEIPEYAEKYKEDFMDFLLYWTETDANGKIRASKEKTFEIKRRFYTWMKRKKENFSFAPVVQQQKPNYGGMYRKPGFDD